MPAPPLASRPLSRVAANENTFLAEDFFGLASSRSPSDASTPHRATPNCVATTPHDTACAAMSPLPTRSRSWESLLRREGARRWRTCFARRRTTTTRAAKRGSWTRGSTSTPTETPSRRARGGFGGFVERGSKRAPRRASPRWWFRTSPTPATETEGTRRPGFSRRTARTTVTFRATRRASVWARAGTTAGTFTSRSRGASAWSHTSSRPEQTRVGAWSECAAAVG